MNRRVGLGGLILAFMGLLSCGRDQSPYQINESGVPTYNFLNLKDAKAAYQDWKVRCVQADKCPNTVGQLLVLTESRLSVCTATLVAEDIVVANSHCFDLRDNNRRFLDPEDLCEDTSIIFPENSPSGHQVARCHEVLHKSFILSSGLYTDYLVLRLKQRLNRGFDKVVRSGLEDRQKLQLRKINPTRAGLGELEVLECEVAHRTAFLPRASRKDFYLHVLRGCPIVPGNSGSSLVDADGQIRAFIFAGVLPINTSVVSDFEARLHQRALEVRTALAVNATCMNYPFQGTEEIDVARCEKDRLNPGHYQELIRTRDFRRQVELRLVDFPLGLHENFGYKLHMGFGESSAYYAPTCLRANPSVGTLARESVENAPVLFWKRELDVDSRLQIVTTLSEEEHSCQIRWSPRDLARTGRSRVQLSGSNCHDSEGRRGPRKDIWYSCDP
ncbi:MAG: hypothetical protein ACK5Y2_11860 [Bdellovibrionales bacterium]